MRAVNLVTWSYLCFKCLTVSITNHWRWPKGSLAMAPWFSVTLHTKHLTFTKTLGFSVGTTGSWYAEKMTLEVVLQKIFKNLLKAKAAKNFYINLSSFNFGHSSQLCPALKKFWTILCLFFKEKFSILLIFFASTKTKENKLKIWPNAVSLKLSKVFSLFT